VNLEQTNLALDRGWWMRTSQRSVGMPEDLRADGEDAAASEQRGLLSQIL